MFNLSDMMTQAMNAGGADAMMKQFGLSPDQMQAATAAMLPAFTAGLNKATANPMDMASLFGQMTSMPDMMQMVSNPMVAGPAMMETGTKAMQAIFGGNDVTDAVMQQVSAVSGVGQDIVSKMMPMMATSLMGSLLQGAMSGQNPLGAILAQTMGQLMTPPAGAGGLMGLFTSMFGGLFGQPAQPQMPPIPGMDALNAFMQQMQSSPGEAAGTRSVGQQAADTWNVTLGQMFQAGRDMQDSQLDQFEKLLANVMPRKG
jgi:hypothetical protein